MAIKEIDLTYQKFGRLTALWITSEEAVRHDFKWLCECDCGDTARVGYYDLLCGHVRSCGCLRREASIKSAKEMKGMGGHVSTHGDCPHGKPKRIYRIWKNMKRRCYDLKSNSYKYYGERGISVCDEWKNNYVTFRKWALANGYQESLTIDRINSKGDYYPENCQWLTRAENTRKAWRARRGVFTDVSA